MSRTISAARTFCPSRVFTTRPSAASIRAWRLLAIGAKGEIAGGPHGPDLGHVQPQVRLDPLHQHRRGHVAVGALPFDAEHERPARLVELHELEDAGLDV